MTITEVIRILEDIREDHGDLRVRAINQFGDPEGVRKDSIYWNTLVTDEKVVEIAPVHR